MSKKAQAAMEFLMTYGWAILVVIAAIAALAYFGVLDPARLLPERCQFPAGLDCIDKPVAHSDGTVVVALRNNIGFDMQVDSISFSSDDATCTDEHWANKTGSYSGSTDWPATIQNNEVVRLNFTGCTGLTSGNKFDGDITVQYTNSETGVTHSAVGEVRGRVA